MEISVGKYIKVASFYILKFYPLNDEKIFYIPLLNFAFIVTVIGRKITSWQSLLTSGKAMLGVSFCLGKVVLGETQTL